MIQSIAEFIVDRQIKSGKLTSEAKGVFCYGYEVIISSIFHFLLSLVIGMLFRRTLEMAIFLAGYTFLRTYAGGYHAPKRIICSTISVGVVIAVGLINHIRYDQIPEWGLYSALLSLTVFISVLSPVEAINKALNSNEKRRNKHITIGLLLFWDLLSYLSATFLNSKVLLFNIVLVYVFVFLLQILGTLKYKRYCKEKYH